MKKNTMIALLITGALLLGGGGVFAAGQIARSSAISEESARNFAYVDAGIAPEEAEQVKTHFGFEKGRFVYEVKFIARGMEYEYVVDSTNGRIIDKEAEQIYQVDRRDETKPAATTPGETAPTETLPVANETEPQSPQNLISLEEARAAALQHAGLKNQEVVFIKTNLDREDGFLVYDVEFLVDGNMKYEYEIDAYSGQVIKMESERPDWEDMIRASMKASEEAWRAASRASAEMPPEASSIEVISPTETLPAQQPTETTPAQQPKETVPATTPAPVPPTTAAPKPTATGKEDIGVERAKQIALSRAGLSASQVVFEKAKREFDDGRWIYDIEFYIPGKMEYEYEIDAYTGAVLEEDIEPWDD